MGLKCEDPAVHAHLGFLQDVISRMAAGSATAKSWCVTLVTAILVLAFDKDKPDAIYVGVLPILAFMLADAYYLFMEHNFRGMYDGFVSNLHGGTATSDHLFLLKPPAAGQHLVGKLLAEVPTISIGPFYGGLLLTLLGLRWLVSVLG